MTTAQMRYFVTAAKTLNFTKAASELFISQPALSKQIQALERELNTELFLRMDGGLRLTHAGAVLVRNLQQILKKYDRMLEEVRAAGDGFEGRLHLGTMEGQWIGERQTELLNLFMERHHSITLDLTQGSYGVLHSQLENEQLDLILVCEPVVAGDERFLTQPAGQQKISLACHESLLTGEEIPAKTTVFLPDRQDSEPLASMLREELRRAGLHTLIEYAPNITTMMYWLQAGRGIGIVNESSHVVNAPGIRLLKRYTLPPLPLVWAWRRDNYNPSIPLFLQHMSEHP